MNTTTSVPLLTRNVLLASLLGAVMALVVVGVTKALGINLDGVGFAGILGFSVGLVVMIATRQRPASCKKQGGQQ
jgi:hypothetical protein